MALCLMKRLQMAGNQPDTALLGGGTGMIGDPSGRSPYASDDDSGDHSAQHRLLQETDGAFYRLLRRQGINGKQCRLADEFKLCRSTS